MPHLLHGERAMYAVNDGQRGERDERVTRDERGEHVDDSYTKQMPAQEARRARLMRG